MAAHAFSPLHSSVQDLLDGYAAGTLQPSTVVDAYLARMAQLDDQYGAYICTDAERARAAAKLADARWRDGTARALEGVPLAVKDLMDAAGLPTRLGSLTTTSDMVDSSATVVQKLEAAGAIVLGKTHTEEFAYGSWGINESMGTPLNPWSRTQALVPGGSSSGSAVAVAAGLAPWALGTDTGGSVRGPAAWQALVGYKPTPGRISVHGVAPLCPSLDCVGILCRTLGDAVLFARTAQGEDEADPSTWTTPWDDVGAQLHAGVQGLRLAVLTDADRTGIDPDVLAAYDHVLQGLQAQGATLVPLTLPFTLAMLAVPSNAPVMGAESYAVRGALAEDPQSLVSAPVRKRLLAGRMTATEYVHRRLTSEAMLQAVRRAMAGCDALVMPTMPFAPPAVAEVDTNVASTVLTRFVNQLGWCGVAVPSGFSADVRPLSVQSVAPAHADAMAFRVAQAITACVPTQSDTVPDLAAVAA